MTGGNGWGNGGRNGRAIWYFYTNLEMNDKVDVARSVCY